MSPWVKVSDDEYHHPQIASLSDGAYALHHVARQWSSRYLTDGKLADVRTLARFARRKVEELVSAGLWKQTGGHSYEIVGYLEQQRSRAEVDEVRAQKAARQKRWREGHRDADVDASTPRLRDVSVDGVVDPARSRSQSRSPKPVSDLQLQQLASSCDEELADALRAAHRLYLEPQQWPTPSALECRAFTASLSNDRDLLNLSLIKAFESFWNPQGRGHTPPSMGELAIDDGKRTKLLAGGFVETGRRWKCRVCGHDHQPLQFCVRCKDCRAMHPADHVCDRRKYAELEQEALDRLTPEQRDEELEAKRYGSTRGEMLTMKRNGKWDAWVSRRRAREEATT